MARLLLGAPVREEIKKKLLKRLESLTFKPYLAIVQVGDREDSNIYIKNKIKFGEGLGVGVSLKKFDEGIGEDDLIKEVKKIAEDKNINGIIVQLPLPQKIDSNRVVNSIPKNKDADGLSSVSDLEDANIITPATARAVVSIFDFYNIEIKNKKIAVLGRSRLAGGPIAKSLETLGAEVSICHKETENISAICKESDIIISATGQIGLVDKSFVKQEQTVIDVGINKITPPAPLTLRGEPEKPKLVGDVNFAEVEPIVDSITPVPGGVGPLTVACLFENLLDLVETKVW